VTDTSMPEAILRMPETLQRMAGAGRISAEDVLVLRRKVFSDGVVQAHEAEWLFALNDTCHDNAPEWPVFFVEALVDYTVHQAEPHGYVSPDNGEWLVARISRSGIVKTRTELELLVKILEQSRVSPESLVGFALSQVRSAVVEGSGPVRSGASLQPGRIGKAEIELLRRILYAYGGDGNIAVTRTEADVLFDINDATRTADNDAEWADLFVKAVANHLLAGHGHEVPPRDVALARAKWLDEPTGGVLRSMASGLTGIWQAYRQPDVWEERVERQNEAIRSAERIDADEARWLAGHLKRYDRLADHEVALIRFLAEEAPETDPALRPLMDMAQVSA
jgi:hypothetical protein